MLNINNSPYIIPKNDNRPKGIDDGHYSAIDENGYKYNKPRESYVDWKIKSYRNKLINTLLDSANVQTQDGNVITFEDYKGEASRSNIELLQMFVKALPKVNKRIMFYFYGLNSCQKTTMALATGIEIYKKYTSYEHCNYKIKYLRMRDLLTAYREAYREDFNDSPEIKARKISTLNDILNSNLLIVDEAFDREKSYPFKDEVQHVLNFVDTFKGHVIFISNVRIEDIDPSFGDETIKSHLLRYSGDGYIEFKDHLDEDGQLQLGMDLRSYFTNVTREDLFPRTHIRTRQINRKVAESNGSIAESTVESVESVESIAESNPDFVESTVESNEAKKNSAYNNAVKAYKMLEEGKSKKEIAIELGYAKVNGLNSLLRKYKNLEH